MFKKLVIMLLAVTLSLTIIVPNAEASKSNRLYAKIQKYSQKKIKYIDKVVANPNASQKSISKAYIYAEEYAELVSKYNAQYVKEMGGYSSRIVKKSKLVKRNTKVMENFREIQTKLSSRMTE